MKFSLILGGSGDPLTLSGPDPFHIAIAVFLVGNVFFFLLFDFYYFGVTQFLVKKIQYFFNPPPSEGGTKETKKLKIGHRA